MKGNEDLKDGTVEIVPGEPPAKQHPEWVHAFTTSMWRMIGREIRGSLNEFFGAIWRNMTRGDHHDWREAHAVIAARFVNCLCVERQYNQTTAKPG